MTKSRMIKRILEATLKKFKTEGLKDYDLEKFEMPEKYKKLYSKPLIESSRGYLNNVYSQIKSDKIIIISDTEVIDKIEYIKDKIKDKYNVKVYLKVRFRDERTE